MRMEPAGGVRVLSRRKWSVIAPFFAHESDRWLTDFVPHPQFDFVKVPRIGSEQNWHHRRMHVSSPVEWLHYARQARRALRLDADGLITVFPQLAAAAAFEKRTLRKDTQLLAWFFNTDLGDGARLAWARRNLAVVDRFVVHSSREIEIYARQLRLPAERFSFVPLQYGGQVATDDEDTENPFVFATGSGYRDYPTFFAAIDKLGYRTLVLPGKRSLDGLTVPRSVTVVDQIPKADIHRLVRRARVNVIPLTLQGANGGLITIVEAFRHGRAVAATSRPGVEDYLVSGQNCLVHRSGDSDGLAQAIEAMWQDESLRRRLDAGAAAFAVQHCTDEVAGRALGEELAALSLVR